MRQMMKLIYGVLAIFALSGSAYAQQAPGIGPGAIPCAYTNCTATTLALGGATIGTDALGVTGAATISGRLTAATLAPTSSTCSGTNIYLPAANSIGECISGVQVGLWSSTGLNNTVIGATTAASGRFTTLTTTGATTIGGNISMKVYQLNGIAAVVANGAMTFFTNNATLTLTLSAAQLATFAGAVSISSTLALPGIGTDAATTDNTLCRITATSLVVTGSGTLGICLGTSSKQFKTDFGTFSGGIADVMKLKLLTYRYKPGHGDNGAHRQGGLLAEDVYKVFPDCVGLGPDKKPLSLDGFCISFHALKAQQEMQGEILALKAANDNLAHRLAKLDGHK